MKLTKLVDAYLSGDSKSQAHLFFKNNKLTEVELDDSLCSFLNNIKQGSKLNSEEFTQFSISCDKLDKPIKDIVSFLAFSIIRDVYNSYEKETKIAVDSIETARLNSSEIPQGTADDTKYIALINAYHLLSQLECKIGRGFPEISTDAYELLASIPFSINSLTLTGRLAKADYNGVNTASALYPLHINVTRETKVPIRKGIKVSDKFFPYKSVSKIAQGGVGDNTFLATNGSKFLFMRGVEDYAPHAILASKIATLVSATHFSSERLMDNKIVASKGIKTYAHSFADKTTRDATNQYIKLGRIFPGTGIIDEVTNYVNETDPNVENLGFSSSKIYKAHLSKIDFDRCYINSAISKNDYDMNQISRMIYPNLNHLENNNDYIHEKLYARLKLSMITEPLVRGLADKAFIDDSHQNPDWVRRKKEYPGLISSINLNKEPSITKCSKRSDIALELFVEHSKAKQFIEDNPEKLNQCYSEMSKYIKDHFEENVQQEILKSLETRVKSIRSELSEKLGINICEVEEKTEVSEKLDSKHIKVEEKTRKKLESTHYKYQVDSPQKGRYHAIQVSSNQDLKEHLKGLKGDYLKSNILMELKSEIEDISSEEELNFYIDDLRNGDPRFKILATGQGITTRLFGLKTSSIKALEEMVEEQRAILNESKKNTL